MHKGKSELRIGSSIDLMIGISLIVTGLMVFFYIMPLGVVIFVVGGYFLSKYSRSKAGISGEDSAVKGLEHILPQDYHVFTNIKVHEKMESDAVVVGPKGVFVVEVKSFNGEIEGTEHDKFWTLHKTGRRGGEYERQLKNPLGQLKRNIFIISQYLKMEGCPYWVDGCVYFANPDMEWADETPPKCMVLIKDVAKFIERYDQKRPLSEATEARILESMEKCLGYNPPMRLADFDAKVDELKAAKTDKLVKRETRYGQPRAM